MTDFPGGSATVEEIDQQARSIALLPGSNPDRGWECWWYFKLEGIEPGETITLDVGGMTFARPDQAQFSLDQQQWMQTAAGDRQQGRIVYRQRINAREAWFAWGPPFQLEDAQTLVREAARKDSRAIPFDLCRSREGRPIPALRFTPENADADTHGIWIQARQHAWESGSSWVCRGFVEWLLSDDSSAAALRTNASITVVPIMDVDNVERGAGGKNQKPHDHNRDWSEEPHWPEVRAAMNRISAMDRDKRLHLFVDLHNPGPNDRAVHFHIAPRELLSDRGRRNLDFFLSSAAEEMTGRLPFAGKVVESGENYDENWRRISKTWVALHCQPQVVAVTLETGWNTPQSTQEGYLSVGRDLGRTIERYLRTQPPPATAEPTEAGR